TTFHLKKREGWIQLTEFKVTNTLLCLSRRALPQETVLLPADSDKNTGDHSSHVSFHPSPFSQCLESSGDVGFSFATQSDVCFPLDTEADPDGCPVDVGNVAGPTEYNGTLTERSALCPPEQDTGHGEQSELSSASATPEDNVSTSVRKTSSPENRLCSLCDDTSIAAIAHCSECDDDLCSACVRRHRKMSLAAQHDVKLFRPQRRDGDSSDTVTAAGPSMTAHSNSLALIDYCQKHPEERLRFFCETCQTPVCRDCILTTHKQHVTQDISDVTLTARNELADMLAQLEQKKALLETCHSSFEDYKIQFEQNAQRVEEMMKAVHSEVKTAVDTAYQMLVGDLEECRSNELERIDNQKLVIQTYLQDVTRLLDRQSLNINSSIHVLNQHEVVSHTLKVLAQNIQQIELGRGEFFISKNPRLAKIPEYFLGRVTFTTHTLSVAPSEQNLHAETVIREVVLRRELAFNICEPNSSRSSVRSIVETSSGAVWVATPRSILRVTTKVSKESVNIPEDIASVVAGPGDRLLVALGQGSSIRVYANGGLSPFASIPKASTVMASRLEHNALHVYVAVTPLTGSTRIVSYSPEGQLCQQLKLPASILHGTEHPPENGQDSGCAERVSSPSSSSRSSSTSSPPCSLKVTCMAAGLGGGLCLGDAGGRRLIVLDDGGEVTGQYLGPDGRSGCHPCAVCVVAPGQVAVADRDRRTVELVSTEGKLLAPLLSRDHFQGCGKPTCLTVDSKQKLWVGTSTGHVFAFTFLHTWPTSPSAATDTPVHP
ncbi:uncharacterized protein LOC143282306, partial [Babylonia areolata]|uniref:uncharacterized protein LOC143282306 n=1 Tax=Babylonia areolata TaxID=304850 RepID=UPI003FD4A7AE